jgi:hypothetical protein
MRPGDTLSAALGELLKAYEYALDAGCSTWDLAVEIKTLRRYGFSDADLRWLICKAFLEHQREATRVDDECRRFRPAPRLKFSSQSCFVLTPQGMLAVRGWLSPESGASELLPPAHAVTPGEQLPTPQWDATCRQLHVGNYVVKHFRWPAPNQETVLAAFQEDGWSYRVDDPLAPVDRQDPKQRLHDTIKCLNRRQSARLIHFRGDGTGEGITWHYTQKACRLLGISPPREGLLKK